MRIALLLLGGLLLGSQPALAQCLALADLLALSTTPVSQGKAVPTALPPTWVARGAIAPGDTERYWILPAPNSTQVYDSLAAGWLSLRPGRTMCDVLYKSTQSNCLADLRRELAREHYPVELVNALDGEAVRFVAPTFSVTFYTHTKGQFLYAAVLRQNAPGTVAEPPSPTDRRLVSPSGVRRVQPHY